METNQKVSLGWGTLITIALIVLIFGNPSGDKAAKEVSALREEVRTLQLAVSAQTRALNALAEQLAPNADRGTPTTRDE